MGHDSQIWAAHDLKTNTYDYNDVFRYVKPIIEDADLSIANLEVTLAGPPYKGYPQFSSPSAVAAACKNAGIDCLVTANNHSVDRGKAGITGTLQRLDSLGIPHTGTFLNTSSRDSLQPLILKKNGISAAILNYTYGTNGISIPKPLVVNLLERETVAADIQKSLKLSPDILIVFLHWGIEYDTVPSKAQTEMAEYFLSLGADLIIGSHPHVLQKMILYKKNDKFENKAVVYSLGNFISNQRKPKTDGGAMVRINFTKKNGKMEITSTGYYLTWVYAPVKDYRQYFYILPCKDFENQPSFFLRNEDLLQMNRFVSDSRKLFEQQNIGFNEL
jgi:poly-gamma-glutamate synthesis protein (capsule biosynthesis protein)